MPHALITVAHVAWEAPPIFKYGGLGVFLENVARATDRLGYKTYIIGCAPQGTHHGCHRWDGVTTCVVCTVTDLLRPNVKEIQASIIREAGALISGADVLVVHDLHVATAALLHTEPKAFIHTASGTPEEHYLISYARDVIANSRLSAEVVEAIVRSAYNMNQAWTGEPPRVRVVYPAAPPVQEPPGELVDAFRDSVEARLLVTAVTRNQWNKGAETLVQAIGILREKHGLDVGLIVAGRGWAPRIDGSIRFIGEVDEAGKAALYRAGDVVVYPSVWEPFGLVPLEAASLGAPVVISDRVGAGEVLRSAPRFRAGDPRSLADTLLHLLRLSEEERRELGHRLRVEARARSWREVAREIIQGPPPD